MISILKKINNIKFPKILKKSRYYYIYGIFSENVEHNTNKFIVYYEKYDLEFNFIEKKNINHIFEKSCLIWDIIEKNDEYIFLFEEKSIDKKKHSNIYFKFFIKKDELELFNVYKIEKLELENYIISKIKYNICFSSKIEIDEERPDYYWGKYLFYFQDENKQFYKPYFDNIVNYQKDKGHLLHYIEEILTLKNYNDIINKKYLIIFSIRYKFEEKQTDYYYKIYSSYTDNLKIFYDTKEISIENNITYSNWYCYPEIFKINNKYFILLNQDDFGKEKETLLGELIF